MCKFIGKQGEFFLTSKICQWGCFWNACSSLIFVFVYVFLQCEVCFCVCTYLGSDFLLEDSHIGLFHTCVFSTLGDAG